MVPALPNERISGVREKNVRVLRDFLVNELKSIVIFSILAFSTFSFFDGYGYNAIPPKMKNALTIFLGKKSSPHDFVSDTLASHIPICSLVCTPGLSKM